MKTRILSILSLLAVSALPASAVTESDFSGWWAPSSLPAETMAAQGPDLAYLWLFAAPLAAALVVAFLVAGRVIGLARS